MEHYLLSVIQPAGGPPSPAVQRLIRQGLCSDAAERYF